MHDPTSRPGIRARIAAIAAGAALVASILPMTVVSVAAAAPTLTPATGGSAISADFTGTTSYAPLTGPSIVVVTAGDLPGASSFSLTVPTGFVFNAVAISAAAGATGAVVDCGTATTTVITCSVTTGNTGAGTITLSGLRVQPTAPGTPLLSGSIVAAGAVVSSNAGTLTEVAGFPLTATVEQAPSTPTVSMVAFTTQPKAKFVDQFGNPTPNKSVTLGISTGPAGSTLTCTISGTTVATDALGIAVFDGCRLNKVGPYVLGATWQLVPGSSTPISVDFSSINITAGSAQKLTFTSTISTSTAAQLLNSSSGAGTIDVAATDASGNVVSSYSIGSVTLSITSGTPSTGGPGGLSCTSSGGLVSSAWSLGHVTFTGCTLANSGQSYQLTAAGSLSPGVSGTFDVNAAGSPNQLAFKVQPGGGVAGQAWGQQPLVEVRDSAGNLVISDSGRTVLIQISSNPGGGILTCGLTSVTTLNGRASFSGCSINKIATGYTLVATSSGLNSATSTSFSITAGAPSKLVFTVQPGAPTGTAVTAGVAFTTQPRVAVTDAGGNVITTYPSIPVYLTIASAPTGGTVTCTGGNFVNTLNGVASFSGCSVSLPGTYTLAADDAATNSPNLAPGTSTAFTVAAVPAQITLTAAPAPINLGASTTVTLQFAARGASRQVQIQAYNAVTGVYATLATVTTDSTGRAVYTTGALRYSTTFKAVFTGAADLTAGTSNTFIVGVRRTATMVPLYTGFRTVEKGTKTAYGSLIGPLNGFAVPRGTFQIYKQIDGVWVFQTSATFATTSAGKATFSWTWNHSGNWYVRWRANSDAYNTTAYSPIAKVTVP